MIRPAILLLACAISLRAEPLTNSLLQRHFDAKVREISSRSLSAVTTLDQWEQLKPKYRAELFEMLGLSPLPPKSDLHAQITGKIERENIIVEKLHFQSLPGLYVTGNLYLPKERSGPLPTILYVCGHSLVKTNGVSYGNKTFYQHHGAWFARNGYACLIIDTIEAGEIEGEHHGTYNRGMWWWNSHGYTPAGVEAWNCIRALDYLETRPDVDKTRFGVTGRSGGGAYSWWITALDDRIKVSAPVAGITDLQNHVIDGVVEGHCDCMFMVNTYRWDYPVVAALAAPRPLLICNSDKDTIFPLDGVIRTRNAVKKIYDLYHAPKNLGLLITEGPHQDTQDLQLPVFRWFNRHLKGEDPVISMAATKLFTAAELKVFDTLPADERTSRIHESFITRTPITNFEELKTTLRRETFAGWPGPSPIAARHRETRQENGREVRTIEFESEPNMPLKLVYFLAQNATEVRLHILTPDDSEAENLAQLAARNDRPRASTAFLFVRRNGSDNPKKAIQIRRRYMLIGETVDGMRVWDIARGVDLLRSEPALQNLPLRITAQGRNAANLLLYAAMNDTLPNSITLIDLPESESDQPDYLNLGRFTSLAEIRRMLSAAHPGLIQ
jgi:dienelactone hydrolase